MKDFDRLKYLRELEVRLDNIRVELMFISLVLFLGLGGIIITLWLHT